MQNKLTPFEIHAAEQAELQVYKQPTAPHSAEAAQQEPPSEDAEHVEPIVPAPARRIRSGAEWVWICTAEETEERRILTEYILANRDIEIEDTPRETRFL